MPEIQSALQRVTAAYESQLGSVNNLITARARAMGQDQLIKFQTQEQIRLQNDLQKIQNDSAKLGMTRIEQKYYDITAAARASARAAMEAEAARRGEKLDEAEVNAYYAAALAGTEKLKRSQADLFQKSRSFSTGWKQAFNDYVDDATNAAAVAGRLFDKFTKGLEDAIVDFTKTGKFNWKKFVAEMSEELLRAQIRKTIANLGKAFGLDDLFGGGAPGSSANNPMYVRDADGGGIGGGAQGGGGGGIFGIFGLKSAGSMSLNTVKCSSA
jgi:lambda family phage tail tape measure protein